MAEKVARPRVELNNKQVEAQLDSIEQKAKSLKRQLKEALRLDQTDLVPGLEKEIRKTEREIRELKKELISVDHVLKDLNGVSFNQLKKALVQQQKTVKGLSRSHKDYRQEVEKLKTLKSAMGNYNKDLVQQEGIIKRLTNGFNNYFGIITAGLASMTGIALSARKAVDMANTRENVLGNVKALTGLVGEELEYLEGKAKEFATTQTQEGIRIQKSADEILTAYQLVGSAQPELLKSKESLASVTREILILAEAGETELAPTVDAVTKAMNQYGAASDEAARYTNAFAAGSKLGAVPVQQIGEAIKEFAVNAKKGKTPIEESVALIEIIGEKGGKVGSQAGIQLRNFFTVLASGAEDTNPEIVGLQQSLENLAEKNLSSAEYVKLFGRENANTAQILIENRGYLEEMTGALTGTSTAYEQAKDNTMDNAAALAQAKNRSKEYAIILGKKLAPAMTHMVSRGSMILKMLTNLVDFFSNYGKQVVWLTAVIGAYIIAVNASIIVDKLKVFWTEKVSKATVKLWKTLSKNPWAAIGTAIAIAVIALTKFIKKTDQASASQKELNKLIKEGNELLKDSQPIKDRMGILHTLSESQLKNLKDNITQQLEAEREFNTKLLAELKKRLDQDNELKSLYAKLNDKTSTEIYRAGIANQIRLRKEAIAEDLQLEADKHNKNRKQLKIYLADVETAISKALQNKESQKEEENKKINEKENQLQKALFELRKQYGLVSQIELFEQELQELNNHQARKLLSEEDYQRAYLAIRKKYFGNMQLDGSESEPTSFRSEMGEIGGDRNEAESNYQDELYKASLDYQYMLLEEHWQKGDVGWTEYYDRLNMLDEQRRELCANNLVSGLESAANISQALLSIQSSNTEIQKQTELNSLEEKKQKELEAAGDNAEKKKQIEEDFASKREKVELKYRKKQKELALKAAYIDMALAEIKAVASAPFPANIPAIAEATVMGLATIASIKAQEFYDGGYTGFNGSATDVAGIVHRKEFVANAQATANPSVRPVLDLINLAQQNGTIHTLDLPAAIESMSISRGLKDGGFSSPTPTVEPSNTAYQSIDTTSLNDAAAEIKKAAQIIANKNLVITADAVQRIMELGMEMVDVTGNSGR